MVSAPALADEGAPAGDGPVAAPTASVHVSISRASDLVGRTAYPARSEIAGTGAQIAFSYTPVRAPIMGVATPGGMPLASRALTSRFGMRVNPVTGLYAPHDGIDLAAPIGTPIAATADGVVGRVGWLGGYGNTVILEHPGGLETRYAHMSRVAVSPGEQVHKGEIVGFVGSTGRSTGPHLHYEMRINGHPLDPLAR